MKDFMNTLFEDTSKLGSNNSEFNNHVINESIILDKLNGNIDLLNKFKSKVGQYAVRDNLLENAELTECGDIKCPNKAAALAIAKESGDPDYETFCKSYCLVKSLMHKFMEKYGDQAKQRVANSTATVEANPRVMNTITTLNASTDDDLSDYNPVTDSNSRQW